MRIFHQKPHSIHSCQCAPQCENAIYCDQLPSQLRGSCSWQRAGVCLVVYFLASASRLALAPALMNNYNSAMLLLDVCEDGGVAQISFAAGALIVSSGLPCLLIRLRTVHIIHYTPIMFKQKYRLESTATSHTTLLHTHWPILRLINLLVVFQMSHLLRYLMNLSRKYHLIGLYFSAIIPKCLCGEESQILLSGRNMIVPKANLKKFTHCSPLFSKCEKAQPFSKSSDSTWYLVLPEPSTLSEVYPASQFICKSFHNQDEQCCFIAIEGECLQEYLLARRKSKCFPLMTEQDILSLLSCLVSAFLHLKYNGIEQGMTHLHQYSIRRVPGHTTSYKLIYHRSMLSQTDVARSGVKEWSQLNLSPEELDGQFISEKSIVFSLGLMLLKICSGESALCVFVLDQFKINWPFLAQKLKNLYEEQGYSILLCNFIEECLQANHKNRPDFQQLQVIFRRKRDRIFSRQSQFLTQVSSFYKQGNISYDLILPNQYQLGVSGKQMSQPSAKKQFESQTQKLGENVIASQQLTREGGEDSDKKIKKKSSVKFEGSKVSKTKVEQFEEPENLKKPSNTNDSTMHGMYDHFEYRGTFGQNYPQRTLKIQQQSTSKKVKKIKQRQSSEEFESPKDQAIMNKQNKQEREKQIKSLQPHLNKSLLNQPQDNSNKQYSLESNSKINKSNRDLNSDSLNSDGVQKLTIQVSCSNGSHYMHEHGPGQNENLETPKGFARFGFAFDSSFDHQRQIDIEASKSKILDRMDVLTLSECLRPIDQIIKIIDRVGVWVEGDLYFGDFIAGRRHGLGLQLFPNQQYYYGHFKEDLFSGEGFYFWNQREYFFGYFELGQKLWGRLQGEVQYQGSFKQNRRNGFGTCTYSNGEVYSGSWKNGKKHGYGVMKEPDGSRFVGNWMKGKRNGEGYFETSEMTIAGYWNEQVIEGQALIKYSNGDVFKGKTGPTLEKIQGEYISKSGRVFKGEFDKDLPKRGQLVYSNGDKYVGELDNMRRHGYGEYYYSSGEVFKGFWENNSKKL